MLINEFHYAKPQTLLSQTKQIDIHNLHLPLRFSVLQSFEGILTGMGSAGYFLLDLMAAVLTAIVLAIMFKGLLLLVAGFFLLSLLFEPSIFFFAAPRRYATVTVYSY